MSTVSQLSPYFYQNPRYLPMTGLISKDAEVFLHEVIKALSHVALINLLRLEQRYEHVNEDNPDREVGWIFLLDVPADHVFELSNLSSLGLELVQIRCYLLPAGKAHIDGQVEGTVVTD